MKISTKLIALAAVSLLGVIFVSGLALYSLDEALTKSRHEQVTLLLEKARHLVNYYRQLEASGNMTRAAAQAAARTAITQLNASTSSYYWATTPEGICFIHPDPKFIGAKTNGNKTTDGELDRIAYAKGVANGGVALVNLLIKRKGTDEQERKLQGVVAIPDWDWWIGTGFLYRDINQTFWHLADELLLAAMLIVIATSMAGWLVKRSVQNAIGGEPGDAAAFAGRIAAGDLTATVVLRDADNSSLMYKLGEMKDRLHDLVDKIQNSSSSIATGASEIARGNEDLSHRTEQQASSLEETASAMEQLTSIVKDNANNAIQAGELATVASQAVIAGGMAVDEVVSTMQAINDSSQKIVDIIGVIDSIAFQTNILALNAAVEAARAGEQGRGFAIVAGEVRSLAQRSSTAAKEIQVLLDDSVKKVVVGSKLAARSGATMAEVVESVKRVSHMVAEIGIASREQSEGIDQINMAINQLDQVTQKNSALVEEAAASAELLDSEVHGLRAAVSVFKLEK